MKTKFVNCFSKVYMNRGNGQKLITIPSRENIKVGEYVMISKVDPKVFYPKDINKILKIKKEDM